MEAFFEMLKNVVIFVLLAFPGYILLKTKILKSEHSVALSKVLMYVGMPFLILTSTINKISFDKQLLTFLLVVAVIGIAYIFTMFFLSKPLSLMEKESKKQGMMRFSEVFANNGFLGIPIAIAVFPNQPIVLTVVVVINIINNFNSIRVFKNISYFINIYTNFKFYINSFWVSVEYRNSCCSTRNWNIFIKM